LSDGTKYQDGTYLVKTLTHSLIQIETQQSEGSQEGGGEAVDAPPVPPKPEVQRIDSGVAGMKLES